MCTLYSRRKRGRGEERRALVQTLQKMPAEESLVLGIFSFSSVSVRFLVQCLPKVSRGVSSYDTKWCWGTTKCIFLIINIPHSVK